MQEIIEGISVDTVGVFLMVVATILGIDHYARKIFNKLNQKRNK